MNKDNDIWVFLSHSNKDYEKVRDVRNLLEEQNFRPLMFFLNCLNEDDEIDTLIKREIDSRKRFILCDSPNAQSSKWVQKEVEYIKSKQRYYYSIDLSESSEEIAKKVLQFTKESKVFISYSSNDEHYYKYLSSKLYHDIGLQVFDLTNLSYSSNFYLTITENIDRCLAYGFVIFLITDNFLKSPYCRKELEYVLQKEVPENVIFLRDASINHPQLNNYNTANEYICELKDHKVNYKEGRLYYKFFQKRIKEGISNGDPASLYWQADHFYWDDDRFDNPIMQNMRLYSLSMVKRSMDMGFPLAKDLYNRILNDYPELKEKL